MGLWYNLRMKITNPFCYKPLQRTGGETGRHYIVGESRPLPSVTTVLSNTKNMDVIKEWRQRVGDEVADKITETSTSVGDRVHDNLEQFILHGTAPTGNLMSKIITKTIINKGLCHVDEVWGTEVPLYYPELYAGTTDLVGVHQGIPAIMDFKNSRMSKKTEWVEDYFLQLISYAEAHNVLHGTDIQKGVIMMGTQQGKYQEWVLEGDEWKHYKNKWYLRLEQYYLECDKG